jgi:hypothetical protein
LHALVDRTHMFASSMSDNGSGFAIRNAAVIEDDTNSTRPSHVFTEIDVMNSNRL